MKRTGYEIMLAVWLIIVGLAVAAFAEPIDLPREQLAELQALQAVPNCYSWWTDRDVLAGDNDAILTEYARVCWLGVGDHWRDDEYLHADAISDNPLVLNMMPFNRKGEPFCTIPATVEDTVAELQFLIDKIARIRSLGVNVGVIVLDLECQVQPAAEIRQLVYDTVSLSWPGVPVIWYRNGDWSHAETHSDGTRTCQLYRPQNPQQHERRFAAMVEKYPGETYGVWLTMGPCYVGNEWKWACPGMDAGDWHWLGRWCTDPRLHHVHIYPAPSDPRTDFAAFVAWVRGITGETQ